MAPIASIHGDLLPHVSGGQGFTLWRRPDGLLRLSLAWDPSGQHLGVIHGLGRRGRCRCQNRWISGRGSRTVRLMSMVTGDGGHNVYPGSGPLYGGNTLLPA